MLTQVRAVVDGKKMYIVGALAVLTGLAQMLGLDLGPIHSDIEGWDLVLFGLGTIAGRSAFAKLIDLLRHVKPPTGGSSMPTLKSTVFALLTAAVLAMAFAPAPAQAASFTTQFETLESTLLTGFTMPKGFHDPGESIGFNFPTPQWTVRWSGQRVLNLGSLNVALTGTAGNDAGGNDGAAIGAGPGGCLVDGICAAYLWVADSRAEQNFMPWVTVDVLKTGGRLIDLLGAAWSTTKDAAGAVIP